MTASRMSTLIPKPVSVAETGGLFLFSPDASISVEPGKPELLAIGQYLAERLNSSTGYGITVLEATDLVSKGNVTLTTIGSDLAWGEEGYALSITPDSVTIAACQAAGVFHGVQTLRQLFPEPTDVQPGSWELPTGRILDYPRFLWRGAMLDVARHFFGVEDVKRFIDLMADYKLNRLHLHLSDDQGWRIAIHSWPNLATYGGSTAVGGANGGYYTQQEYAEITAYAQSCYITIVPEIDLPGHTNAALASYPELNCDGIAPPLYTGMEVGFSSLCTSKEITYEFATDVIRELASITPGPYIHVGGDEAHATSEADYRTFMQRLQNIVQTQDKQMIGWTEVARIALSPTTIVQYWNTEPTASASIARSLAEQKSCHVIMSPASKAYLDMQYEHNPMNPRGLNWAGYVEVKDAYEWDPASILTERTIRN